MKNPVLRVRKGAEHYDDSRGDGLFARSSSVFKAEEPPRRRRRRGGMTFLPLLVLAIAAIFQFALPRDTAVFRGWAVRLRAEPHGDVLLLAVDFASRGTSPAAGAAPGVNVHLVLAETGASVDLAGVLSAPATTLRGQVPLADAARTVKAEIAIGTERHSLSLGIAARK